MPELHNPLVTPTILSITTGIDLKTVAATTLYTVPAGRRCIVNEVVVHLTAATLITVSPTVSIGQNSTTYTDIIEVNTMVGLDVLDECWHFAAGNSTPQVSVAASTNIKIDVSVGATATTMVAEVILIGFLI